MKKVDMVHFRYAILIVFVDVNLTTGLCRQFANLENPNDSPPIIRFQVYC